MLPANVDQRPPLQRGLMNFQLQNFQLYNKSHIFRVCIFTKHFHLLIYHPPGSGLSSRKNGFRWLDKGKQIT